MSAEPVLLKVDGLVCRTLELRLSDFVEGLEPSERVEDVSALIPGRKGEGARLAAVLRRADPAAEANYLTLHADRDDFHVSIPLAPVLDQGILIFRVNGAPLAVESGGPIRMLIPNPAACHTGELDDCANVKFLSRIELTTKKGIDTRPADETEHAALHARQEAESAARPRGV